MDVAYSFKSKSNLLASGELFYKLCSMDLQQLVPVKVPF